MTQLNQHFSERNQKLKEMAMSMHSLPPRIRVANIQGLIILRKGFKKLWIGLEKLEKWKMAMRNSENEQVRWRKWHDGFCACCFQHLGISIIWSDCTKIEEGKHGPLKHTSQ